MKPRLVRAECGWGKFAWYCSVSARQIVTEYVTTAIAGPDGARGATPREAYDAWKAKRR